MSVFALRITPRGMQVLQRTVFLDWLGGRGAFTDACDIEAFLEPLNLVQANEFIANGEATEAVFRGDAEGIKAENQFPGLAALLGGGALGRSDFHEAVALVRRPLFFDMCQHLLEKRRSTSSAAWQGCLEDALGCCNSRNFPSPRRTAHICKWLIGCLLS